MPRTVIADTVKSAFLTLLCNVLLLAIGGTVATLAWGAALVSMCGLQVLPLIDGLADLGGLQ